MNKRWKYQGINLPSQISFRASKGLQPVFMLCQCRSLNIIFVTGFSFGYTIYLDFQLTLWILNKKSSVFEIQMLQNKNSSPLPYSVLHSVKFVAHFMFSKKTFGPFVNFLVTALNWLFWFCIFSPWPNFSWCFRHFLLFFSFFI